MAQHLSSRLHLQQYLIALKALFSLFIVQTSLARAVHFFQNNNFFPWKIHKKDGVNRGREAGCSRAAEKKAQSI
jgi:hypothetical protein